MPSGHFVIVLPFLRIQTVHTVAGGVVALVGLLRESHDGQRLRRTGDYE